MFKRSTVSALLLGTVLTLFGPSMVQARELEREHHRHRISVMFGYTPRHYADGYYDRWGYWHPYHRGYYDRRGYWHPYR